MVIDITHMSSMNILYRHVSYQLWEMNVTGFMLSQQKTFITLSRQGIQVVDHGHTDKRAIKDSSGNDAIIHSLESFDYLKVESKNFMLFQCTNPQDRIISVQQEYISENVVDRNGGVSDTRFQDIYKVRVRGMNLRQALIL